MCSFLSVFCSAYVLNALLKFIRVSSFNRASVCDHFRLKLLNPWRCFELLSCLQLKSQTQGCIFVNRKIDVWITTPLGFVCWTFKVIVARWAFMKSHAAAEVVSTQSTNQVPLSRWKLLHWASIALFNTQAWLYPSICGIFHFKSLSTSFNLSLQHLIRTKGKLKVQR